MNERKTGILLSYINIFLHAIVGFLYVPILLHYIGKSEYGLYQLIGSLIAYFSIMDFGLTAAVTRFYTKYKALKDKVGMENILAISLYGYGGATGLSLLVGGICYWNLDSIFGASMTAGELLEARHMFLLLLFNIAVSLSTMVFRSVINAHEKFLFLKGLETVQLILQPALVILILQKYPTAMAVAVAQTALNVGLILARIYYCFARLHITIQFHYWNQELFHDFKKLALSVFCSNVDRSGFLEDQPDYPGDCPGDRGCGGLFHSFPDLHELHGFVHSHFRGLSAPYYGTGGPEKTHGRIVGSVYPDRSVAVLSSGVGGYRVYYLWPAVYSVMGWKWV